MTGGRWRISVSAPDWGAGHLSSDAIVAYVDDELAHGPHVRATRHLAECRECAAQVVAQGQARAALRTAGCPSLPSSLLSSLRSIPQDTDLPSAPAGLSVTSDGQLVSVLRPDRAAMSPGTTRHVAAPPPTPVDHGHDRRPERRIRLGTGVAVSGLALGAIALAVPPVVSGSAGPIPTSANGVLGGPVLGGAQGAVDARLKLAPTADAGRPVVAPTPADDDTAPAIGSSATPTSAPVPSSAAASPAQTAVQPPAIEHVGRTPGAFHGLP